jgi:hypothetical protein
MMFPDRKKEASIILSKMTPEGEKTQEVKDETMVDEGEGVLKAISEDMLQAFQDKSPAGIMSAMRAFIEEYGLQSSRDKN